jgi:hypothetical protein
VVSVWSSRLPEERTEQRAMLDRKLNPKSERDVDWVVAALTAELSLQITEPAVE